MKEKLTKSEKALLDAIRVAEKEGALTYLPSEEAKKYGEWAKSQLKSERITLRIDGQTLSALKAAAAKKGKKYQTYIGEILTREARKAA